MCRWFLRRYENPYINLCNICFLSLGWYGLGGPNPWKKSLVIRAAKVLTLNPAPFPAEIFARKRLHVSTGHSKISLAIPLYCCANKHVPMWWYKLQPQQTLYRSFSIVGFRINGWHSWPPQEHCRCLAERTVAITCERCSPSFRPTLSIAYLHEHLRLMLNPSYGRKLISIAWVRLGAYMIDNGQV